MPDAHESRPSLPAQGTDRAINAICESFEQAWPLGLRPRIEDYLIDNPSQREQLLTRLLSTELKLRRERGETPEASDYFHRFPNDVDTVKSILRDGDLEDTKTLFANPEADTATLPSRQRPAPSPIPSRRNVQRNGPKIEDYELIEEIARGGMGVVYKAKQVNVNRVVALKMIRSGRLADDDEVRRFQAEAEAAAQLDHPNIVPIFDVGRCEGQHFFSMGFVEGQSLKQVLGDGPIPTKRAAELVVQIAGAIQYAHDKGIIHRDLKSANVLVDPTGIPRVTDFGLAKQLNDDSGLTATGVIMGTPSYMPPEQAAGNMSAVDERSDVYSLGAILYETLTGRPPFQAESQLATLKQVLERDPVSPRQLNQDVDRDLETICLKCLQKHPERRYESASELIGDLERYLENAPILARPVGFLERASRWRQRNPVIALQAMMIATILVIATVVSSVLAYQSSHNASVAKTRADQLDERGRELQATNSELQTAIETVKTQSGQLQQTNRDLKDAIAKKDEALVRETAANRISQWRLYARQIESSLIQFGQANTTAAWSYLNATRWDFRGWEHNFLYTLFSRQSQVWHYNRSGVDHLSIKENLVAYTENVGKSLQIRDLETAESIQKIDLPEGSQFFGLTIFPESREVMTAITSDQGGSIVTWNVDDGTRTYSLKAYDEKLYSIQFAVDPQKKYVVTVGREPLLKVWDLQNKSLVKKLSGYQSRINSLAFSPDGKFLASACSDSTVRVWSRDWKTEFQLPRHSSRVSSLAFSPDSRLLAGGYLDGHVRIWSIENKTVVAQSKGSQTRISSVKFHPKRPMVISASRIDNSIQIWDMRTNQKSNFGGHRRMLMSFGISPEGDYILTGGADDTIRKTPTEPPVFPRIYRGVANTIKQMKVSPDRTQCVLAHQEKGLALWDLDNNRLQYIFSIPGRTSVCDINDVGLVAAGGNSKGKGFVKVWNSKTRKKLFSFDYEDLHAPFSIALSNDGVFVAADHEKVVRIWNLKTGKIQAVIRSKHPVYSVKFDPTGSLLAVGSTGGKLTVYQAISGKPEFTLSGHSARVVSLEFDGSGTHLLSGSGDNTARLWDLVERKELMVYRGHRKEVLAVSFSQDKRRIATCGDDQTIRIWERESGLETLQLEGGPLPLSGVTFTADDQGLLVSSWDAKLRFWDASEVGKVSLTSDQNARIVKFAPDANTFTIGTRLGEVVERDTRTGELGAGYQHRNSISGMGITHDGKFLVTVSYDYGNLNDGELKIWDRTSHEFVYTEDSPASMQALDVGHRMVVNSSGKEIQIRSLPDGKIIRELSGHTAKVVGLNLNGSETKLLSWGYGPLYLWELDTGKKKQLIVPGIANLARFTPDEKILVCLGKNFRTERMVLLDPETGKWSDLLDIGDHQPIDVVYSSDGRFLYTSGRDHSLRAWDLESGENRILARSENLYWNIDLSPHEEFLVATSQDGAAKIRLTRSENRGPPIRP